MNKISFKNWAKSLSFGLFFFLYTLLSLAFDNEPIQMQRCALSAKTKQNKPVEIDQYTGDFSSPSEIRALEDHVRAFHLKKMFAEADNKGKEKGDTELFPGYLSTSVLQNSYKRFGQIRDEWQTPVDSYGFYGTLISSKKINDLKKQGVHPSEIYGTKAVLDHKLTHMLIEKTPLNFRLTKDMWAEAHRLGAQSANPLWQNLGFYAYPILRPLSLHDAVYKGGGNYRDSFNLLGLYRSRLYDEMSPQELKTILGVYDKLVNLGVLPKIEDKKQEKLWRIVEDHPYIPFYKRNKELPNGNRAVTLSYPSAKILDEAMEHVFNWVNKEMDRIDNKLPGARDPIELAAITQFALVYLHAAKDGNGRVSKHFKNLILKKYGLPMDLRYESDSMPEFSIPHWKDLSLGLAEHVRQTRLGVFYKVQEASNVQVGKAASIENAKVGIEIHKNDSLDYLAKAIDSNNSKNRNVLRKAKEYFSYISDLAVPANVKQIFSFGTTEIKDLVFKGHFFEGKQRVLYTYDPKSNSLYPIGDWASVLYGLGTGVFQKDNGRYTYTFRKKNKAFERELKNNYALFVRTMQDPKFASTVKIVSYDTIAAKNRGLGELFLHDFQLDLVKEALAVYDPAHPDYINPKDYPVAVMSPNRGNEKKVSRSGPTVMQLSFVKGDVDKVSPGVTMSAFQLRRTFLRQIEMGLQKNHPQTYQEVKHLIEHARKANYEAAKVLLKDFKSLVSSIVNDKSGTSNIEALKQDPKMHELLKNSSTIEAVVSYLERQEWYYDRWEDIPKDVRSQKYTYVIRNIGISNLKYMGLITEMHQAKDLSFAKQAVTSAVAEIRRAAEENDFPRASNIEGFGISAGIAKWIVRQASDKDQAGEDKIETRSEYAKRKEFRAAMFKLVDGVYIPYYQTRGLEPEQERIFNDSFLHTFGEHPQKFKSTSVDPFYEWLLNNSGDLKFMPGGISVLYKLEIGTEAVDAKFSVYTAQAEILDNSRYGGVPRWTTWSGWKLLFRTIGSYTEENLRLIPLDIELKDIEKDPDLTPEEKATAIASFNKRQDLGKRAKKFLENLEFEDGNNYGVLPPDTLLYNAKYELQKREKEDSQ